MLKSASSATLPHIARGIRIESPAIRAMTRRPIAAKGSVSARNVSGASSATPIFSMGQLQPHTSVMIATGISAPALTFVSFAASAGRTPGAGAGLRRHRSLADGGAPNLLA